ncbi:MAG: NAD(P)-dependent oxidoreductase [Bacteroidales bacterium]
MKKKILIGYKLPKYFFSSLESKFDIIFPEESIFSQDDLKRLIPDCDAVISVFGNKIPDEALINNSRTKIISNFGAGFDNIDIQLAKENNIIVTNTPDEVTEPTAELAIGLILSLIRKITYADRKIRSNSEKWGVMENLGQSLSSCKLGILGFGKIGSSIAKKALAFNTEIYYNQRTKLPEEEERNLNVNYLDFHKLLQTCDILSVSVPLNSSTHHLLGKEEFSLMKNTALLINTSRGPVIDENALVKALKNKEIGGAALDVFENEPNIHPELSEIKNTILVPHIGTATIDTREKMAHKAAQNIIDYFAGKKLNHIVNP